MTFTEIVTEITSALNLTSPDAATRVGRLVNRAYQNVRAEVGMQTSARAQAIPTSTSLGSNEVTFASMLKVTRVFDDHNGTVRELEEIPYEILRRKTPGTGDVTQWAVKAMGASSVTILIDTLPQSIYTLKADGYSTAGALSGAQEPAFPESHHSILVSAVLKDEYRKKGQRDESKDAKEDYERQLSRLRLWQASSLLKQVRQGQYADGAVPGSGTSGSESSSDGGTSIGALSFPITGLWTFDRTGLVPFAVVAGSLVVPNLDADKLDGLHASEILAAAGDVSGFGASTHNAIPRWAGASGTFLQDSNIYISDDAMTGSLSGTNTGNVSLAGAVNYLSIMGQVITQGLIDLASHVTGRLPLANFVAATGAGKILVAVAAGSWVEGTLGTGLALDGTTLNASAAGDTKPFMQWTALGNQQPASAAASFDARNAHPVLDFDGAADEEAVFGGVMPVGYTGAGITVELWVALTSATTGSVRFQAAFERMDVSSLDIDADSFAAFQSGGGSAPGTTGQMIKITIAFTDGAQMDSVAAGEAFRLKVRRDADGTSGTDDIATDAELLRVVMRET